MKHRTSVLAAILPSAEALYFALWVVVLIVAVILQVMPTVLVVMMLSLAIGVPKEVALNVVPVVFIATLYVSCLVASKIAGRPSAGWKTRRSRTGARGGFF